MKLFRYCHYLLLQLVGFLVFGRRVEVHGRFTVVKPENVKIGVGCAINHNVFILGHNRIEIGNRVVLSAGAMLLDAGLSLKGFSTTEFPSHSPSYVIIEDGAWIGAGAIILPGITVGKKSVVGAGSVVTKDVTPYSMVAGNPARIIGQTNAFPTGRDAKVIREYFHHQERFDG